MEKIKISTVSGSNMEKPLITAFKTSTGSYVVLDNEVNGTMGLPIILVSKFANGRLGMIDEAEWAGVKESLRMIIGGNQFDYITVPEAVAAEDDFFKQLTLPVASFDVLKNAYKPVGNDASISATTPVEPIMPTATIETPASVDPIPAAPATSAVAPSAVSPASTTNGGPMPNVAPEPIMPASPASTVYEDVIPANPVAPATMSSELVTPVAPVTPAAPAENQVVAPVEPIMPTATMETPPNVEPIPAAPVADVPVDFTADKEAFLKACENMFDALVAKFKN